jgi:HK97 family phage major capsid protein
MREPLALQEVRRRRDEMTRELDGHQRAVRTSTANPGTHTRIDNLRAGIAKADEEIADLESRAGQLNREAAAGHVESVAETLETSGSSLPQPQSLTLVGRGIEQARDTALRAVESRSDILTAQAGDRLDRVIRADGSGADASYLAAVCDPAYLRAFRKTLFSVGAGSVLDPDEGEALQRVGEAMQYRSLLAGEAAKGGYAIPADLDPTVLVTSAGVLNPLRELATVITGTSTEWKGVSSAGVEAHFREEGAESEDDAPELGQPVIKPERADCFIPYSIEAGQDWPGMEAELLRLVSDAKETVEAEKMTTGTGTNEPFGIVTGASEQVESAGEAALAVGDVYKLRQALPARFQERASWLASGTIGDVIYRLVARGDSEEPVVMNEDRSAILGKPYREVSNMETKTESEDLPLLFGDVGASFRIVDRLGMSAEVIPQLMGENQRPLGMRGLVVYWRVGSKVVVANGLRLLKIA